MLVAPRSVNNKVTWVRFFAAFLHVNTPLPLNQGIFQMLVLQIIFYASLVVFFAGVVLSVVEARTEQRHRQSREEQSLRVRSVMRKY